MAPISSILLLALSSLGSTHVLFERAACNADNCLRAVTGTQPGQTQTATDRLGDCSRFMTSTITPPAVTVPSTTSTITITAFPSSSTEEPVKKEKRDTTAAIPAYASPCSGAARYSSACSCAGITAGLTTLSTPTITSGTALETTTTCIPLATFYYDSFYNAAHPNYPTYAPCGAFGVCHNVDTSFVGVASSMKFAQAGSCSLYAGLDCTGQSVTLTPGAAGTGWFGDVGFNDLMGSFVCV